MNGTVKVNYSELGTASEFALVIPQMPGGGFTNKNLIKKEQPDIIYMIDDKSKTYSEMKQNDPSAPDNKTYIVKKVGEEKINGYNCTHAIITEGTDQHEVWNTKDIPEFNKYAQAFNSNKSVGSQKREDALKAAGCDGLPVKTTHSGANQMSMTMELVKIEKKSFKPGDFDLPKGYTLSGQSAGSAPAKSGMQMKSAEEIQKMTPEERTKYMEEIKKRAGK
jgi:hypothetical protein